MIIGRISNCTREMAKEQEEYLTLPIRDTAVATEDGQILYTQMDSAWLPTPEEIQGIVEGKPIILRIIGTTHPPVNLYVGDPLEGQL